MTPTFVNLTLARHGLAPTRRFADERVMESAAATDRPLLPMAGIIVRACAIGALLLAAAASMGQTPPVHADVPPISSDA